MKIEKIAIEKIIPYVNNAKEHPQWQIDQIKASIKEFGFNDPLAIDGENVIIEGHGRFLALKQLEFEEIDVIKLEHLTEVQKKQYILAHNKLTMNTGFDEGILKLELEEISLEVEDLDLTGFKGEELNFMLETEEVEIEDGEYTEFQSENTKSVKYITLKDKKIPLTEEEEENLYAKLKEYIDEKGTLYGFWGEIIC